MKPESLKLMQAIVNEADNLCTDTNFAKRLRDDLMRIIRMEAPSTHKGFDVYKYTSSDERNWPNISGVYHNNGVKVATDSRILIAFKDDYSPDLEGKILDRHGDIVNARFPQYEAIIPNRELFEKYPIDFDKLDNFAKTAKADMKLNDRDIDSYYVNVGDLNFKLKHFILLASYMKKIGTTEIEIGPRANHPAFTSTAKGWGLLMPVARVTEEFENAVLKM